MNEQEAQNEVLTLVEQMCPFGKPAKLLAASPARRGAAGEFGFDR